MKQRILCVDDEIEVLAFYQSQLASYFDIISALGGEQGLVAIKERGPFPVIVSDMQMPRMNGAEFLALMILGPGAVNRSRWMYAHRADAFRSTR